MKLRPLPRKTSSTIPAGLECEWISSELFYFDQPCSEALSTERHTFSCDSDLVGTLDERMGVEQFNRHVYTWSSRSHLYHFLNNEIFYLLLCIKIPKCNYFHKWIEHPSPKPSEVRIPDLSVTVKLLTTREMTLWDFMWLYATLSFRIKMASLRSRVYYSLVAIESVLSNAHMF